MLFLESGWDGNFADGVLRACSRWFSFEATPLICSRAAGSWASWAGLAIRLLCVGEREVQESMTCSMTLELFSYLSAVVGELLLEWGRILGSCWARGSSAMADLSSARTVPPSWSNSDGLHRFLCSCIGPLYWLVNAEDGLTRDVARFEDELPPEADEKVPLCRFRGLSCR